MNDLHRTIVALPKAEVHVHLEGCFEATELADLAARAGERLPRPVQQLFDFRGFDEFLEFLSWSCGLLRTADLVAATAYRYAERAHRSGVTVADIIVNPTHWAAWRGNLDGFVDALDRGFTAAAEDGLPTVGVCLSVMRQQSAAEAVELVEWMCAARPARVVGLSIDGNEALAGRTGPRFAEAFTTAGAAGFGRTVHAGESSGPDGIRDALELLGADRIDHGVRAVEDPQLVAELADRGVPLGVCPSSNVTLQLYGSWAEHPIDELRRAGVRVSVNSDDPAFLGIDLAGEYRRGVDQFGWTVHDLIGMTRTSLDASFTLGRLA